VALSCQICSSFSYSQDRIGEEEVLIAGWNAITTEFGSGSQIVVVDRFMSFSWNGLKEHTIKTGSTREFCRLRDFQRLTLTKPRRMLF
jgi:hypothetical protein